MKAALALAPLLLIGAQDGPQGPVYAGNAPARYQGDNAAVTLYASDVSQFCPTPAPGNIVLGCSYTRDGIAVIVLPNPCILADVEFYALIACHELGHRNGWAGDHPL